MPNHIYRRGETIVSIAHRYGFRSWTAIWEHAGNATLHVAAAAAEQLTVADLRLKG